VTGSNPVTSGGQEGFSVAPRFEITAGVQVRMPEVSELHIVLGEQQPGDVLALNNIVFPGLQPRLVERHVGKGVIAEFETVVEPHPESLDPFVDLSELVELPFVNEPDHRDLLVAERAQQL
jgi:hypothetical protein